MAINDNRARIAVFVSGAGTNLQSLIDASRDGRLSGDVVLVVSNKPDAYGLTRAKDAGIDTFVFEQREYASAEEAAGALVEILKDYDAEYIALAGYLRLLPPEVVQSYRGRIVNIHPGRLPKYGGAGMYGHRVHAAVIQNGEKETCATVHLVDEIYDNGRVLETVVVPVRSDDTAETLSERVLREEHKLYPQVLEKLIRGEYDIDD